MGETSGRQSGAQGQSLWGIWETVSITRCPVTTAQPQGQEKQKRQKVSQPVGTSGGKNLRKSRNLVLAGERFYRSALPPAGVREVCPGFLLTETVPRGRTQGPDIKMPEC